MIDPYKSLDKIEWKANKKKNTKKHLCFERKMELKLHKDHAIVRTNPETFKPEKIHGDVILTEIKFVDKENSNTTIYRNLQELPNSVVENVIQ